MHPLRPPHDFVCAIDVCENPAVYQLLVDGVRFYRCLRCYGLDTFGDHIRRGVGKPSMATTNLALAQRG